MCPTIFNALDVAVICYANDNYGKYCFPQKTREIMACDVPLVAANVGSLKEIFAHAPEWLYEPGNIASLERLLKTACMIAGRVMKNRRHGVIWQRFWIL